MAAGTHLLVAEPHRHLLEHGGSHAVGEHRAGVGGRGPDGEVVHQRERRLGHRHGLLGLGAGAARPGRAARRLGVHPATAGRAPRAAPLRHVPVAAGAALVPAHEEEPGILLPPPPRRRRRRVVLALAVDELLDALGEVAGAAVPCLLVERDRGVGGGEEGVEEVDDVAGGLGEQHPPRSRVGEELHGELLGGRHSFACFSQHASVGVWLGWNHSWVLLGTIKLNSRLQGI